jgi:DNA repair protein RadC
MALALSMSPRIRELADDPHPRQRLLSQGANALSDAELIALLLGNSEQEQAMQLAQQLLADAGGVVGIHRLSVEELQQHDSIGHVRAARLKAAFELTRRLVIAGFEERFQIRAPSDAAQLMLVEMSHLDQEHLRVICLDTKNRVQKIQTLYVGSLNSSLLRVGEVFKEAIRLNSAAIILVHNHPSGDPTPSADDIQVTRDVTAASKLLDIDLLDHLIIGHGQWVSLRERGLGFHS